MVPMDAFEFATKVDSDIEALSASDHRLRVGRAKVLLEELLPISRLVLSLKTPGLSVQVEGYENDGPVDGHIQISGYKDAEFDVEVTCVHGYEEHLRAELLNQEGSCPGAGAIWRENGKIIADMEAVDYDAYIHDTASKVIQAFSKKNEKSYPPETVLIIAIAEIKLSGWGNWKLFYESIQNKGGFKDSQFSRVCVFNLETSEIV